VLLNCEMFNFIVFLALVGISGSANISSPNLTPFITDGKPSVRQGGCQYNFEFQSVGQSANLRSPNYPADYSANLDCKYFISSPVGTQMVLTCNEFSIEASANCQYDIFYWSLSGSQTFSDQLFACGKGTFSRTTTANKLAVGFRTDSGNPASADPYKFQCQVTVIGSPVVTTPTCSCGYKNDNTRIVGGSPTSLGEYPWRCALYTKSRGVFCGCTIISASWILTAAHCTNAVQGEAVYVNVGDYDLTVTTETNNQVKATDRVVQNTAYDTVNQDSDTALLHLATPLVFSRNVQPVCLPWKYRNADFTGATVTATGWGTTAFGGGISNVLREVDLPILAQDQCQRYYPTGLTNNMICTYSPGKDTCQGDSGGSVDFKDPNSGRHYAIGVTSWGVGCAGKDKPGVYAKVTNFLDWIQRNTGDTFCQV
jgi:hypothetical protein